jgi:hypothetical protein
MANFKNTAYSNTRRDSKGKDQISHWLTAREDKIQDRQILKWLKNNPQAAEAFKGLIKQK